MSKCYLAIERGLFQKSIYPLEASASIGRNSQNDITVLDLSISRSHARISPEEDRWVIEDLGSANGITFEGRRVEKRALTSGDAFRLGEVKVRFMETDSPEQAEQLFDTLQTFATTMIYDPILLQTQSTTSRFERLQEALQANPIFQSLQAAEVKQLATNANLHLIGEGQTIISAGDQTRSLYVVLDGRIKLFSKQFDGERFELVTLGNNESFGEIPLMTGEAWPMWVGVVEKSLLAEITYKNMRGLMESHPQVNKILHKNFQERVQTIKKTLTKTGIYRLERSSRLRERVPVMLIVGPTKTLSKPSDSGAYEATSTHISKSGISLLVKGQGTEALSVDCTLQLEITLPPPWGKFHTKGSVRRSVPEGQLVKLEVDFDEIGEEGRQKLNSFIRREYHLPEREPDVSKYQKYVDSQLYEPVQPERSRYLRAFLPIAAALLLMLLGVQFFIVEGKPPPRPPITLEDSNPTELLTSLQTALEEYAAEHNESYPVLLYDLLPEFLADTVENRAVLENLLYSIDERDGYRVRIRRGGPMGGEELVATSEDIYVQKEGA
jgi:CRP-like cAMP-binding protein